MALRIAYCTNVRLPSERAHGHQIAQVCDALAVLGHDITIFAPYRENVITRPYHAYYGARAQVHLKILGSFDPIASKFLPGVLGLWTLNALLRRNIRRSNASGFNLLYTRSPALLSTLLSLGPPVILELHQLPRRGRRRFVARCNRCRAVACLTSSMRATLARWGVDEARLLTAGDAVDLSRFTHMPTQTDARMQLALPSGRPVVGYVGRLTTLGKEKGISELLKATKMLASTRPVFLLIVGGPASDVERYRAQAHELGLTHDDVLFTGEIPARDVPSALAASSVLTMPFPDQPHYRFSMSPLKMFEYMASGRPIITSDLPTVRDVLSEESAYFCEPGSAADLARAIDEVLGDGERAAQRAERARLLATEHSWEKRMQRILRHVGL